MMEYINADSIAVFIDDQREGERVKCLSMIENMIDGWN